MSGSLSRVTAKPNGILILVVIGIIGGIISILNGLALVGATPSSPAYLPGALALLGIAQILVVLALWTMDPRAWYATVVVYTVTGIFELVADDVFGALVAVLIVVYLYTLREHFLI